MRPATDSAARITEKMAGNMSGVNTDQLRRVIESQHGGRAAFRRSLRVFPPKASADWDGIVHIFDLKDHPNTKRAYAWSTAIKGGTKPRYFAVLHMGYVTGPAQAVMAAIRAIRDPANRNRRA